MAIEIKPGSIIGDEQKKSKDTKLLMRIS